VTCAFAVSITNLLFVLNEGLHGNLGAWASPAFNKRPNWGTKKSDYPLTVEKSVARLDDLD